LIAIDAEQREPALGPLLFSGNAVPINGAGHAT
jgi:hypothetical protein